MKDKDREAYILKNGKPLENLCNAIVLQAVKDYVKGYRREECLNFFRSDWYKCLTNIPPENIIKIARQLAGEE